MSRVPVEARPRHRTAIPIRLAGCLATLTLLVACTGPTPRPAPSTSPQTPISVSLPEPIDINRINSYISAELPIDYSPLRPYMVPDQQQVVIDYAKDMIVSQCMAEFELNYPVQSFEIAAEKARYDDLQDFGRVYGVTDAAAAEKNGYLPVKSKFQYPDLPDTAEYNLALLGGTEVGEAANPHPGKLRGREIPAGGCMGLADRSVDGALNTTREYTTGLGRTLWAGSEMEAQSDPEYLAVEAQWSECMKSKGYTYQHVLEPGTVLPNGRPLDSTPNKVEVETALADIECKAKTDTVNRLNAVSAKYEQKALDENRIDLESLKRRVDVSMGNAIRMITTGDYSTS